jgi:hypothetical protein
MRLAPDTFQRLADAPFEELVNRAAAALDVPPLRKVELLTLPLPTAPPRSPASCAAAPSSSTCCAPIRHLA